MFFGESIVGSCLVPDELVKVAKEVDFGDRVKAMFDRLVEGVCEEINIVLYLLALLGGMPEMKE